MSVMDEVGATKQQSQTDKQANDAECAVHGAETCGVNLNITAGHCAHCTAPSSTTNPQNRPDVHRSYWLRQLTERQCLRESNLDALFVRVFETPEPRDVDFEREMITVVSSKTRAGVRTVLMTARLKAELLRWKALTGPTNSGLYSSILATQRSTCCRFLRCGSEP